MTITTPVPKDALLQPGAELDVLDQSDNRIKVGKLVAVVPKGVPFEFAEADQNGRPRPSAYTLNHKRSTTYLVDVTDPESQEVKRWHVPQSKMKKGMDAEANRKAREKRA